MTSHFSSSLGDFEKTKWLQNVLYKPENALMRFEINSINMGHWWKSHHDGFETLGLQLLKSKTGNGVYPKLIPLQYQREVRVTNEIGLQFFTRRGLEPEFVEGYLYINLDIFRNWRNKNTQKFEPYQFLLTKQKDIFYEQPN